MVPTPCINFKNINLHYIRIPTSWDNFSGTDGSNNLSAFLQLDIILDEDAFVHFYKGPTEILEPIASHTMFLIDLSRSMAGSKLIMAKESLILLLEDLSEKDYFNIILFSEKWIRDLPQTFTGW